MQLNVQLAAVQLSREEGEDGGDPGREASLAAGNLVHKAGGKEGNAQIRCFSNPNVYKCPRAGLLWKAFNIKWSMLCPKSYAIPFWRFMGDLKSSKLSLFWLSLLQCGGFEINWMKLKLAGLARWSLVDDYTARSHVMLKSDCINTALNNSRPPHHSSSPS